MTSSGKIRQQTAQPPDSSHSADYKSALLLAASLATLLAALGCASPGPPRPPSLNLPELVTDLTAERTGNDVVLHWTTPTRTTDGLDSKGPLTAQICRETAQATVPPSCVPVLRLAAHPGVSSATETLPATLASDPVRLLTYRIRIENVSSNAAGLSNSAFAAAGSAPPGVEELRATAIKGGAMIEWRQQPGFDVELDRLDLALVIAQKAGARPKSKQPIQLSGQESADVHLRVSHQNSEIDPGGTLDHSTRNGETYAYTAQRVRTVQVGGQHLEIRTQPSQPVTVVLRDIFPPATPTGLAAVQATTSAAPGTPPQPAIDLSWEPAAETDIAGYLVYRQQTGNTSGTFTRLTPSPIVGSAFRDLAVVPGQTYTYHVTAVDKSGNESPPSADVQETPTLP